MFAPAHHAATRYVVPVRKELGGAHDLQLPRPADQPGRRDAPAHRRRPTRATSSTMAGALARLGADRALVVSSDDGLDELSTSAPTQVVEVDGEGIERYVGRARGRRARRARRPRTSPAARREDNAATTRAILAGEPGPARDLALLNAGAAIYAGGARRLARRRRRRAARGRSTRAPRPRALERYVALERGAGRRGVSVLERIVEATREEVAPPARAGAARRARARGRPRAPRRAAVRRGARRARASR